MRRAGVTPKPNYAAGWQVYYVLKTRAGDLDFDYLRKWAKALNASDLLERVIRESE